MEASALAMVPGLAAKLAPRRAEYEAWLDAFLAYNDPDSGAVSPMPGPAPTAALNESGGAVQG